MGRTLLSGNRVGHLSERPDGRAAQRHTPTSRRARHVVTHDGEMSSICVFCGSSSGSDPAVVEAARSLGSAIATEGHRLVYGGGHVGLMGVVADAALAAGGPVTGVMTEQLVGAEVAHTGLTRLEVVTSMHERKARMAELADGVIVLPGGFGTLDETFEIMTWNQLGLVAMPVVFLDVNGYFDALFEFVASSVRAGFVSQRHGELARRAADVAEALALVTHPSDEYQPKWM
jgi:uncharacterized protein (TIGR00730 family)